MLFPSNATDWAIGVVASLILAAWVLRQRDALSPATILPLCVAWVGVWLGASVQFRLETLPLARALWPFAESYPYPAMRLPLGLVVGTIAGLTAAKALRLDWGKVGDALVVSFATALALGRLGCLRAGCCNGVVCHMELPWCVPHQLGTGGHGTQSAMGLIDMDATWSLPAHPLPAYFALAALGLLIILLAQLRAGAPTGRLLVLFLLTWPPLKLGLETMRAIPRPAEITATATLALFLGGLFLLVLYRSRSDQRSPREANSRGALVDKGVAWSILAVCTSALTLWIPQNADAQSTRTCDIACWNAALQAYASDPNENRDALLALERHVDSTTSPVLLLALADARLRAGQVASAGALFDTAAERVPNTMWSDWAHLGRSYVALRERDLEVARERLESVEGRSPGSTALAAMLSASVDITDGDPVRAREALAMVGQDATASAELKHSAEQLAALTFYWEGRPLTAARRLEELAQTQPEQSTALEYAAAVARIEGGDREAGLRSLERLSEIAEEAPDGFVSGALLRLEPAALLARGFTDYRKSPLSMEPRFVVSLPLHGPSFARAMLKEMGPSGRWPSTVGRLTSDASTRAIAWESAAKIPEPSPGIAPGAGSSRTSAETTPPLAPALPGGWLAWFLLMLSSSVMGILWIRLRRRST